MIPGHAWHLVALEGSCSAWVWVQWLSAFSHQHYFQFTPASSSIGGSWGRFFHGSGQRQKMDGRVKFAISIDLMLFAVVLFELDWVLSCLRAFKDASLHAPPLSLHKFIYITLESELVLLQFEIPLYHINCINMFSARGWILLAW